MATPRILAAAALCLALSPVAQADSAFLKPQGKAADVLPVEQAFIFEGAKKSGNTVNLSWKVTPGYYLYRHMFKVTVDAPTGIAAPQLSLPAGEKKHDEDFGDVEVYHQPVTASFSLPAKGPMPKTLRVKYQGCADVGLCYPPQTKIVALR